MFKEDWFKTYKNKKELKEDLNIEFILPGWYLKGNDAILILADENFECTNLWVYCWDNNRNIIFTFAQISGSPVFKLD